MAQLLRDDLRNLTRLITASAMPKRYVGRAHHPATFGFVEAAAMGIVA